MPDCSCQLAQPQINKAKTISARYLIIRP